MICDDIKSKGILSLYCDGEIDSADVEWLEAHLAFCSRCNAELRDIKRLRKLCGSLSDTPVPAGLKERVLERLEEEKPAGAKRLSSIHITVPLWLKDWRIYGGIVAVAAVIFIVTGPLYSVYTDMNKAAKSPSVSAYSTPAPATPESRYLAPVESPANAIATPAAYTPQAVQPTPTPAPVDVKQPQPEIAGEPQPVPEQQQPNAAPQPEVDNAANTQKSQEAAQTSAPGAPAAAIPSAKKELMGEGGASGSVSTFAAMAHDSRVIVINADSEKLAEFNEWLSANISSYGKRKTVDGSVIIPVTKEEFEKVKSQSIAANSYSPQEDSPEVSNIKKQFGSVDSYYIVEKTN